MTNTPISDISEAADIESINMYHERLAKGYDKKDILASINAKYGIMHVVLWLGIVQQTLALHLVNHG